MARVPDNLSLRSEETVTNRAVRSYDFELPVTDPAQVRVSLNGRELVQGTELFVTLNPAQTGGSIRLLDATETAEPVSILVGDTIAIWRDTTIADTPDLIPGAQELADRQDLTEDAVRAIVRAVVADWAEAGTPDAIPIQKLSNAPELRALQRQLDHVVGLPHHRDGVAPRLHRLDRLAEHAAAGQHPDVAAGDVLGGAVGDAALGHPGHDVLTLDVIDDVVAVVVEPPVLVVDDGGIGGYLGAVGGMHGVEDGPGVGVVDRHPDLHLEHPVAAHPHLVGEDQGMADGPVVAVLGLAFQQAAFDDAVLEGVEGHLGVLVGGERLGHGRALHPGDELEVVPVQCLDVIRVHRVLHDLEPVARQHRMADVAHPVHHVGLVPGQLGGGLVADVGPHHAAQLGGPAGAHPAALPELGGGPGLGQDVDAPAGGVELPAVVAAAEPAVLDDAVDQRGAPVGAPLVDDAVGPRRGLEHGPVLAQQAHPADRELVELAHERHRVPVAAEHPPHGCAGADPGEGVVL